MQPRRISNVLNDALVACRCVSEHAKHVGVRQPLQESHCQIVHSPDYINTYLQRCEESGLGG
jgi:hypothetical protein